MWDFQLKSIHWRNILLSTSLACSSFKILCLSLRDELNCSFRLSLKICSLFSLNDLIFVGSKFLPIKDLILFSNSLFFGSANFFDFILIKSSIISCKNSLEYPNIFSLDITFFLCEKITWRWSFKTLSNLISVFLISKFLASTFCCALSIALLIQGWSILSPSFRPSFSKILFIDSDPNILIKSSSRLTKNIEHPSSPCLPALPLAWLSTLLDSILSVPITNKPPRFFMIFFSSFTLFIETESFYQHLQLLLLHLHDF